MKTHRWIIAATMLVAVGPANAETTFPTPQAAVDALVQAIAAHDRARFLELFGEDYQSFSEGQQSDPALAKLRVERFERGLAEFKSLEQETPDRYSLVVGAVGWPFPIPIVRVGDLWQFDGKAGVEELRNRLVGANELNAIAVMDAYAEAQRKYALDDHDGDGVLEYAQRVGSTPGTHDGLYWPVDGDDPDAEISPLGPLKELADAVFGGDVHKGDPFLGYRFRILNAQGSHGKAGAYDYRVHGHMVGGFAMVAWPANYGDTGVMTFVVNRDGVIYQRDLGETTEKDVEKIKKFDPDDRWSPVDDAIDTALAPRTSAEREAAPRTSAQEEDTPEAAAVQ